MGPLRIIDGHNVSLISARKIETVLAVLLIRSDLVVSRDQLTTEIWGDRPPRRATDGLHVYISQLRKFLHHSDRPESPVVTQYPGYLLRKGSDEIDLHIFIDLVSQGRSLARQQLHEQAIERFEQALRLWRGLLLGDLRGGPIIDGFGTWLLESRLECLELLAESNLLLGRHRELIGRLYSLTSENPLREAFHRQLMLALYRSERQADALMAYQIARNTLREELGLEPGRPLQNLHRAILAADTRLETMSASTCEVAPAGSGRRIRSRNLSGSKVGCTFELGQRARRGRSR
jgi:DNA-binding SARP family transcriptional activator